jgi:hypothetical protein
MPNLDMFCYMVAEQALARSLHLDRAKIYIVPQTCNYPLRSLYMQEGACRYRDPKNFLPFIIIPKIGGLVG